MEKLIENLKGNVDALEDAALTPETDFVGLEKWDSLALLSTMAMIASEYGINIENAAISACKSVAELHALINSKL